MAASPEATELLERWRTEKDFEERDKILEELFSNDIFPSEDQGAWEVDGGLYPDLTDPQFIPKLLRKREFQESMQKPIKESLKEGVDRCRLSEDFELSSVQRFISRLLSPRTPYHSALLYHGVGVGKTCAAITTCESYLEAFPGRKAYVVAPPNIQEGFKRTIFDINSTTFSKTGNHHRGCTGDIYLSLTNSFKEQDKEAVESRVSKAIRARYDFFGYTAFYNHIKKMISKIPSVGFETMKRDILRREFSNRVLIIDEAHNLRDNPTESDDDVKDDVNLQDSADARAGKKLTPFLREVLSVAEGVTLVLMTATPMYNSYTEIVFLLNLLLLNDKFPTLRIDDVFDQRTEEFTRGGRALLGRIASHYVSFMRGENPLTFPIRLEPNAPSRVTRWPNTSPKGEPIPSEERARVAKLPCVGAYFHRDTEVIYKKNTKEIVRSAEGLGITAMDLLIQAGNWIFPGEDFLDRIRQSGFESTFTKERRGSSVSYRSEEYGAGWLLNPELSKASGKCSLLLKRLNVCRGVAFVYSRFVSSGALTIALALEANGYTLWGRDTGLLADGNQHPEGRQCAFCPRHEKGHGTAPEEDGTEAHTFKPAKYVLLTGSEEISPNNAGAITASRDIKNTYGGEVKVIIGSQIAGEGLDLRFVREVFVFDSWYHLNKLEQIVGRGIRNCSHASLDSEKRNCTVTLLVNGFSTEPGLESIDMYSYRQALKKAIVVGNVTRALKEYAIDCTLNRNGILVEGLDPLPRLLDSQGKERLNVNINDTPLTPMCDWLETCSYDCKATVDVSIEEQDSSTYDEYTASYQFSKIRAYVKDLIEKGQTFITFEAIENHFLTIPRPLLASLLADIVNQGDFKIKSSLGEGRIIYKNGYYVFQPDLIQDTSIPIAIRTAHIPIPRDNYKPVEIEPIVQKEAVDVGEDSEELWNEVIAWTNLIRAGTALNKVPVRIEAEVNKLRDSAGIGRAQKERMEMILWINESIKRNPESRNIFADCVLDYFWDEYITLGTRRQLLMTKPNDPIIKKVAKDSYWTFEGTVYLRLLDGYTNTIEYICNGEPCSQAVVEVLSRERVSDPLLQRPIDIRYTGYEYGFLNYNPKKKQIVYKKGKPPKPKAKLGRGSECAINSGTTYELELLVKFGETLRAAGKDDLGLNEAEMGRRRIANSIRTCTVSDLVLRYMDKMNIGAKRWFYRALESKLHNHPLR